ncbi:PTS fructose transporter subunit IIB [Vibrio galatheae]|uniref:protein-N(pi)-phosphohistidine--D-fructose phosphotransferase n=1 Tax=Vibrio galatheae TaxID=579748 RepID=A0A0F4NJ29_9VIBR|nr:fructose PTS transporter subunit IIB [Vibrio galatheae]KJY82929.1 PTS fructose transporter subunit IIB [Vibrio galatheae]
MKIVGVTACISGVAHTYMAAEVLEKSCKKAGYKISVETQGALGSENQLAASDIADADVAVIIADINIEGAERFSQTRVVRCSITHFLRNSAEVLLAIEKIRKAPPNAELIL